MSRENELTLDSGRTLRLLALNQYRTYEGHMMGRPTTEGNKRDLEQLVTRHTQPKGYGVPYLIKPTETPLTDRRSKARSAAPAMGARSVPRSDPRDGTPARLPFVTCIARFTSGTLANDSDGGRLVLRVIWFQDSFAFPIDPLVITQLAAIDWQKHAVYWWP
jgi:hypothetical protein